MTLCNARGVYDTTTSEWVVAAILALTKRLPHAHEEQRRGRWRSFEPGELAGKTVLIVGTGALDVTDPEPLPDGHPLWTAPGALITPHVAGAGPGALPRAAALIRAQLLRHLEGQALANVVRGPE